MPQRVTCTLVVLECEHDPETQPLFSTEYKRSNRTRASKVVRCFPHCCPHHQIRSYCGSPLHVVVANIEEEPTYYVYGRFEEHLPGPHTLKVGQKLHSRHPHLPIHHDPTDTSIIWFQGELVEEEQEVTTNQHQQTDRPVSRKLFVLNGGGGDDFCHWEYDWKSGTSQRQRLMQHHFRVYVFATTSNSSDADWVVVATATSTPFTFMVYRKHHAEATTIATVTPTSSSTKSVKRTPTASIDRLDTDSDYQNDFQNDGEDDGDVDGGCDLDDDCNDEGDYDGDGESEEQDQGAYSDDNVVAHDESTYQSEINEQDAMRLEDMLWASKHQLSIKATSCLAMLLLFCAKIDVHLVLTTPSALQGQRRYGDALLSALLPLLQAQVRHEIPEHMMLHFVNHCAPQLLLSVTPNELKDRNIGQQNRVGSAGENKLYVAASLCSELLCYMLAPPQSQPRRAFLMAQACVPVDHQRRIQAAFLQWLSLVTEQVDVLLSTRGTTPEAVVDEIVSIVLETPSANVRTSPSRFTSGTKRKVHELLRNTKLLGMSAFERHLRHLHAHLSSMTPSFQDPDNSGSSGSRAVDSTWNGRWVCRIVERPQVLRQRSQYQALHSPSPLSSSPTQRRRSWPLAPQSPTSYESVKDDTTSNTHQLSIGLLQVVFLMLATVGFDLSLEERMQDEEGSYTHVLCVRFIAGLIADQRDEPLRFPLDDTFRCSPVAMLSSTLLALLSQTGGLGDENDAVSTAVYYRCRMLAIDPSSAERTTTAIELEFIVVVSDGEQNDHAVSILSRCVLTFQIQNGTSSGGVRTFNSSGRLSPMYNRRRLQLRVRLEEAHRQLARPSQRQRVDRERNDDEGTRVYAVPPSPHPTVSDLSDDQVCNLYARMNGDWRTRISFTATYHCCDPSNELSHAQLSSLNKYIEF